MPPRWAVILILGGWVLTTGWLLMTEYLPLWSTDMPAPVLIALSDETVGSRTSSRWKIFSDGKELYRGISGLDYTEKPTESFLFWMDLAPLPGSGISTIFKSLRTEYTTGRNGYLQKISGKWEFQPPLNLAIEARALMEGTVQSGKLARKVTETFQGRETIRDLPLLEIGEPGMVWFPLMPVWRLGRLNPGARWTVICVDALGDLSQGAAGSRLSGKPMQVEVLALLESWKKEDPKAVICRKLRAVSEECQMDIWVDPNNGRIMRQDVVLEFRHRWTLEREE